MPLRHQRPHGKSDSAASLCGIKKSAGIGVRKRCLRKKMGSMTADSWKHSTIYLFHPIFTHVNRWPRKKSLAVTPAKAGVQNVLIYWIPASAGMTEKTNFSTYFSNSSKLEMILILQLPGKRADQYLC